MARASAKVQSTVGAKFLGRKYTEMDCQKFVENCLAEVGIKKDLAGSNTWYRYITWTGTPEECKKKFGRIPPGAFLFIQEHNGKEPEQYRHDGIGNASHIGIYTAVKGSEMVRIAEDAGNGNAAKWNYGDGAIHSSASREHVCTSKFAGKSINGGWNRIGLWNVLSYGDDIDGILNGQEKDGGAGEMMIATVVADSGATVNMRRSASTNGAQVRRVPIGEKVTVNDRGNEWSEVMYMGDHGYMMTAFLDFDNTAEKANITIDRAEAQKVYDILGGCMQQFIVNKGDVEHAYDIIGDWLGLRG